jgi:hypothetical protein
VFRSVGGTPNYGTRQKDCTYPGVGLAEKPRGEGAKQY